MDAITLPAFYAIRLFTIAVLFPFTHVIFPAYRVFYTLLKHLFFIPIFLILRTLLFGLVYVPLTPVLSIAQVHYDSDVSVEKSLYRLARNSIPHISSFLYHFVHYFMVSLFVGSFVGIVAGLNISLVGHIFTLAESESETKVKREERSGSVPSTISMRTNDSSSATDATTIKEIPRLPTSGRLDLANVPKVKSEPDDTSSFVPRRESFDYITDAQGVYEDDDGYSFVTYATTAPSMQNVPKGKEPEPRVRRASSGLAPPAQMTIEEVSETEHTPDPNTYSFTHTPPGQIVTSYATGSSDSSKSFTTQDSLFSKTKGPSRLRREESAVQDSSDDEDKRSVDPHTKI